jgi:hypothetical protein
MLRKIILLLASATAVAFLTAVVAYFVLRIPGVKVAEIDFSENQSAVRSGIEKGWLPSWFPESASEVHGAQTTFDQSFLWLTFHIPKGEGFDLEKVCVPRDFESIRFPSEKDIRRFPQSQGIPFEGSATIIELFRV